MIYRFAGFELDLAAVELRADGKALSLEPQVFALLALLALLVENRERLVSKDEIIEKVWDERFVSDAAVASRVKSARQALGDDGKSQRFIKTIHGQGYRFVAEASAARRSSAAPKAGAADEPSLTDMVQRLGRVARPSLAVLPFRFVGGEPRFAALATALPDELIADLARLRWLFVTARGSSFRLRTPDNDFSDVGRLLGVRYCLWGTIEVAGLKLVVVVELVDTRDGGIVWADRFSTRVDDMHLVREQIRAQVLTALEIRIPIHEASLARLMAVENLDAWSAYHLGLQHLYRFNRRDNAAAAALFQRALSLDPTFARAHAGLSFVHFQSAFMHYTDDIAAAIGQARSCAERGLEFDPLDPFVNFTMGRTYWLEGDLDTSLRWLERATNVSPSFAQGIYARGWTEAMAGRAAESKEHVDLAMRLSPIDPLHYAMTATRGWAHLMAGEYAEGAQWIERGARSPGAHVLIAMVAAAAHALTGDAARAAFWAANVRERSPELTRGDFFRAFPIHAGPTRARIERALAQLGFR